MGYTHNWTPKVAEPKVWQKFVLACKELHKALPEQTETAGGYCKDDDLVICGGDGTGKPTFTMKEVLFNGNEERDLDHETFYLTPSKDEWNFCKTARKPYDLLVVACLIAAHDILGYEVSSDGELEDWAEGIQLYLETVYDFTNTSEEEKIEIVHIILPEFLVKELKNEVS